MKSKALLLLLAGLGLSAPAQAGWLDGMGEFFSSEDENARGLYIGGSAGVLRADWGMQRRLGGVDDPLPPEQKYHEEPAYLTVASLRAGWQPWGWLSLETEWGFDLDKAEISETPRQVAELDSISAIYLKPQINIGAMALVGEVGYNRININASCGRDNNDRNNDVASDETLAASCRGFRDTSLFYGAGVNFQMTQGTRLAFMYRQNYDDDFDDNGREDAVSSLIISVSIAFGGGDGEDDDDYYY